MRTTDKRRPASKAFREALAASRPGMYQRVPARLLPLGLTPCPRTTCVYNKAGVCDEPRINKGNGDAECHRWPNKRVLAMLDQKGE